MQQPETPANPKILIVDDDEMARDLLCMQIQLEGYVARECASGDEALDLMREDFYPIVITDLNMPGMDGWSLCRALRARDWHAYMYIIMLTGSDRRQGASAALTAGADDYLMKDCSEAEFFARLRLGCRILSLENRLRHTSH